MHVDKYFRQCFPYADVQLSRTGRLSGSGGGVPMHATCTTQDIGSWWYVKSRLLCGKVKGYFVSETVADTYARISNKTSGYRL